MSREKHQRIREQFSQLNIDLQELRDNYLEQISNIINKAIKNYEDKDLWEQSYNNIIDLFYEALTETYLQTTIALKEIYNGNISDEIPDIKDFIYNEDGKTLPERVKQYWDEVKKILKKAPPSYSKKDSIKNQTITLYLLNMYNRILTNEIINIKAGVKKVKHPNKPVDLVEVIEITDGECCHNGGLFLAIDEPDEPPYHIGCLCESWLDYYDPNDPYDYNILKGLGWEEDDE